jgi:hypothetical protein
MNAKQQRHNARMVILAFVLLPLLMAFISSQAKAREVDPSALPPVIYGLALTCYAGCAFLAAKGLTPDQTGSRFRINMINSMGLAEFPSMLAFFVFGAGNWQRVLPCYLGSSLTVLIFVAPRLGLMPDD